MNPPDRPRCAPADRLVSVVQFLVQLDRPHHALAHTQVEHLHRDREGHGKINVALGTCTSRQPPDQDRYKDDVLDAQHDLQCRERTQCDPPLEAGDPFGSSFLYIQDKKHKRDGRPVSEVCDCACCTRYSRSYLHHLFEIQETLALRLATIHNLRFYTRLVEELRRRRSGSDR